MTSRARALIAAMALLMIGGCARDDDPSPTPGATTLAARTPGPTSTAPSDATPAGENPPPACAPPYTPVRCADPSGMEPANVTRIVDGDTLDVMVGNQEERVRIFGIDTPERGDRCFSEATDALRLLVALDGGHVLLLPDARNRDSGGRLLRYLYRPDGLSIDAAMIAGGYALAWTRDGALRDPLVRLEAEARLSGTGCLWESGG